MGKIEPLAPTKRVRIVLCSAVVAAFAIAPGAGIAADWSSGVMSPTADWSSGQARAEGRLVVGQDRAEGRLELALPRERLR